MHGKRADTAEDEATDAFLAASRVLVGVAAASLAELDDITLPQFRALVVLSTRGPATVGSLADALDVHPSTATRLCDRLVRKRLVERTRPDGDRRTTQVALAAEGRRVVSEVTLRRRRAIAAIVAGMSAEQREDAVRSLDAFAAAAGERSATDEWGWLAGADAG